MVSQMHVTLKGHHNAFEHTLTGPSRLKVVVMGRLISYISSAILIFQIDNNRHWF